MMTSLGGGAYNQIFRNQEGGGGGTEKKGREQSYTRVHG
jgi:hypothetical protein